MAILGNFSTRAMPVLGLLTDNDKNTIVDDEVTNIISSCQNGLFTKSPRLSLALD